MALKLADYVVTEAGFATDLGAEKFFHIKCRIAGLNPGAVVIVSTVKALKHHGWLNENGGFANLDKHVENIRLFGLEPVIAVNRFDDDTEDDLNRIVKYYKNQGIKAVIASHYKHGGEGALELAGAVVETMKLNRGKKLKFQYTLDIPVREKIRIIARNIYGADDVEFENDLNLIVKNGFDNLPVCIAKTAKSLSDNEKLLGRPRKFKITVNEARISAGAGFVVVICGNIMTMPGLPKVPAATRIKVLPNGKAIGLS
jgi:formate--tetrahydrofolate ligase